jgi:integrase
MFGWSRALSSASARLALTSTHPAGNFHRRVDKPLLAQAVVPDLRFHDLRHSMATLLYCLGADPQTLKRLLGHSQITTTMDTCAHPVSARHRAEVDRLGEALSALEPGADVLHSETVS